MDWGRRANIQMTEVAKREREREKTLGKNKEGIKKNFPKIERLKIVVEGSEQ